MTLSISVAVIAAVMVIVGIVAVVALIYIIRLVKAAIGLVETAKPHVAPVSHDITLISQKAHLILDSVHRQVDTVEQSVNVVKDITHRAHRFQEDFLHKLASPLVTGISYIAAFRKGFQVFYRMLKN